MLNDLQNLHLAWQIAIAAALVVAGVFSILGSVGMLRFPDFFMRLHAPTKATTLGVGGALVASMMLAWSRGSFGVQELLITLFLFITAPVSASLLAKAALHLEVPCQAHKVAQSSKDHLDQGVDKV